MSFILQDVPPPKYLEMVLSIHAGESYQDIAARHGCRTNLVGQIGCRWIPSVCIARQLLKYSGPKRKQGDHSLSPKLKKDVLDVVQAHPELTYKQIAEMLGTPPNRIAAVVSQTPSFSRGCGYNLRRNLAAGPLPNKMRRLKPRSCDVLVNEWEQILSDAGLGMNRGLRKWLFYGEQENFLPDKNY